MWPDLKKTRLPHTQYQTYDFTRNGLLAQYTIIFHCWPCSKATDLVSVAAFLKLCVSLEWHFGAIGWSWLSCMVMALLYWCLEGWTSHEGLANVCYLQFGVLWAQGRSSRAPNQTSGFQLSLYSILYSYIKPTLLPPPTTLITTTCNIITITKKLLKTAWISGVWKLFTHTIIFKE